MNGTFTELAPLLPPPSCMPLAAFRPDQRVKAAKTETFPFIGILVGQCGNAGICHRNARQEAPNSNTAMISVLITYSLKCARNSSLFRRSFEEMSLFGTAPIYTIMNNHRNNGNFLKAVYAIWLMTPNIPAVHCMVGLVDVQRIWSVW